MKYFFLLAITILSQACSTSKHPVANADGTKYLILNSSIRILDFDPLGHIYILDGTDRLSKYDTSGHLLYHVVNNNLGEPHSLDVGNPFKTMIFYRDQQTILLYDRTLSEIQRIHLVDWNLHDVTAACLSPDNAIWVFDGSGKVLIKTNQLGDAIVTSDPFDILKPGSPRPDFIYDVDHWLVLKAINHPIAIFDDFGKYLYTTEFKNNELFSINNHMIIMGLGESIWRYDVSDRFMQAPISMKENIEDKRICQFANQFYVADDHGIYILTP